MAESNNFIEIAEIVENTMREFNSAMKRREELSIRIARRTTQILRFGIVGMTLLTVVVVFLIHTLTKDTNTMTQRLDEMAISMRHINKNLDLVNENIRDVKHSVEQVKFSLDQVEEHIKVMPVMNNFVGQISDNMIAMNRNINHMNENIASLNDNIDIISLDMAKMSHQFGGLNSQLGVMGYNVDRMASPMKFFPFSR